MRSNQGIQVQIYGQVYHLRGGEEPEHTQQVARLVDSKMNWIADRAATTDSFRVAVLAALELADELARLRQEHDTFRGKVEAASERIGSLVEDSPDAAEPPIAAAG